LGSIFSAAKHIKTKQERKKQIWRVPQIILEGDRGEGRDDERETETRRQ
jgi:hypothetical protein